MKRLVVACLLTVFVVGCDFQGSTFGLDRIKTMTTPADDPTLGCGVQLPAETGQTARDACTYTTGTKTLTSLGIDRDTANKLPIRHVILMMKENRSFDHLLGKLHDRGQSDTEAVPASYTNPDLTGAAVAPMHAETTCITTDPGHQSEAMRTGINGGAMDGFVRSAASSTTTDGHFVMSYNDETDLPFYYFLAKTWALNDRHFAPVVGGTYANRNFYMFGTNAGAVDTGLVYPAPNTPSIFHLLMNAGFTWGAYTDNHPLSESLNWGANNPGVHTLDEFYEALDKGTLPNVVFVDGTDSIDDDHPTADLQKGEALTKKMYDHVIKSPQWNQLALIWTYDEGGGFADHLNPGPACAPTPGSPFNARGPRVPFVVISPWAKRHYVSHVVQDHTAVTRFIELLFDLPALTARDANSSALLDLFDFSCGRDLSVPEAPAAGTGRCANPP